MTANDYQAQATEYDNLAAHWQRQSEQADSWHSRRYFAQIAAQLHDNAEGMRHRAFAAQLDNDGLDMLADFNRTLATEADSWPEPRYVDAAALRRAIKAGEVDGVFRTAKAGTL